MPNPFFRDVIFRKVAQVSPVTQVAQVSRMYQLTPTCLKNRQSLITSTTKKHGPPLKTIMMTITNRQQRFSYILADILALSSVVAT